MPTLLYLDSARMGLMSERAHLAHLDYVRLAAVEGCSQYFDKLLREGFNAWPVSLRLEYSHLSDWQGVGDLNRSLRAVVGRPEATPVLLASRTAQLVAMAATTLAERCTRILVPDLIWPSYRRILEQAQSANRVLISNLALRRPALEGRLSQQDLVRMVARQYEQMRCDGLFLPAVSHDGVRLPVDTICQAVAKIRAPRLIVVDGAQAFCHVPDQLGLDACDIFIAGCHKWLQGHVPMGIAYLPSTRSARGILSSMCKGLLTGELDDPLLSLSQQLESGSVELYSETVNLSSLFACRAAVADRCRLPTDIAEQFGQRILNARRVERMATIFGWVSLRPQYRTGIVLLRVNRPLLRQISAERLRKFFIRLGISLSCYDGGVIRLTMPDRPLSKGQLDLLGWVLRQFQETDWFVDHPEMTYGEARATA